jgi:hypothetical protein
MLQFEEAAAAGGAPEEEGEEQIDEDIAIEGGGGLALGKNALCPITGKPVRPPPPPPPRPGPSPATASLTCPANATQWRRCVPARSSSHDAPAQPPKP